MDRLTVPLGAPQPLGARPAERADAARNRQHLLATAREMLAEQGPEKLTMDALAERAGLGKGTVFRRFGTRAGIFAALLDDHEQAFQQQVLAGPPPLGPGAPALDRLVAYGLARTCFLIEHRDIACAALDGHQTAQGAQGRRESPLTRMHIRMLLGQLELDGGDHGADHGGDHGADLDTLAIQLTAALDAPLLLYMSAADLADDASQAAERIAASWQHLVRRVCAP